MKKRCLIFITLALLSSCSKKQRIYTEPTANKEFNIGVSLNIDYYEDLSSCLTGYFQSRKNLPALEYWYLQNSYLKKCDQVSIEDLISRNRYEIIRSEFTKIVNKKKCENSASKLFDSFQNDFRKIEEWHLVHAPNICVARNYSTQSVTEMQNAYMGLREVEKRVK